MSTEDLPSWRKLAAKRHGWHVVAAAGAVVGAYHWMDNPDLIYLSALALFVSGVVAGAIECGRWLLNRYV